MTPEQRARNAQERMLKAFPDRGLVMRQTVSAGDGFAEINGRRYTTPKGAPVEIRNGLVYAGGKRWCESCRSAPVIGVGDVCRDCLGSTDR